MKHISSSDIALNKSNGCILEGKKKTQTSGFRNHEQILSNIGLLYQKHKHFSSRLFKFKMGYISLVLQIEADQIHKSLPMVAIYF